MKINLRRMIRIRDAVRKAIPTIETTRTFPLSAKTADWNAGMADVQNAIAHAERLTDIYAKLREMIGETNGKVGIPRLIAQRQLLQDRIRRLQTVANAEVGSVTVLQDAIRNQMALRDKHGYADPNVTVSLISDEQRSKAAADLRTAKVRLVEIDEEIAALNAKIEVDIDDALFNYVREHGIA